MDTIFIQSNKKIIQREKFLEFTIPFSLLVILTLIIRQYDLDRKISGYFYDAGGKNWPLADTFGVQFIYDYGPLITILFFCGAVFWLILSYVVPSQFYLRAKLYFVIVSIILAPAFLTHVVMQEIWKRPRPTDTIEFNGNLRFHEILEISDQDFKGKSFPSGHAGAGFILVLFYFLLKRKSRFWALISLVSAIFLGCWLSYARIAAGGHFFSDTVWSFGVGWFTTYFLYYCWFIPYQTKLNRLSPFKFQKKRIYILGLIILLGLMLVGIARYVVVPYNEVLKERIIKIPAQIKKIEFYADVQKGDIHFYKKKRTNILITTWGRGSGPSKLKVQRHIEVTNRNKTITVVLKILPSSWFWKYQSHTSIFVPDNMEVQQQLNTKLGRVSYYND